MAFEALNNAGVTDNMRLLVILNDNDMSISPAVGALNRYLARLMSGKFYATAKQAGKQVLKSFPPVFELAKKFEEHAKGMVVPGTLFEEFGFNYIGPIDGHDLDSLLPTLQNLKQLGEQLSGPQFLHVVTKKGQGYKLAEADPVLYHGPTKFDPECRLHGGFRQQAELHEDFRRLAVRHGGARLALGRHHARDARRLGPGSLRAGVSGSLFRRRHCRAACGDICGRSCVRWYEAGGRDLLDLPAARI